MSIATALANAQAKVAAAYSKCNDKGATMPATQDLAHLDDCIDSIPTGEQELKDVVFYDYDGSVVAQYTKEEFALLSALPANPTHEGLTAQGWNWSLSDAKNHVAAYGRLNIGQMYVTTSGKTIIRIVIPEGDWMSPTLYFYQSVANGVAIDWGDNSQTETLSGTGNKSVSHTYAAAGTYDISLNVTSGVLALGHSLAIYPCISSSDDGRASYSNMVQSVFLGEGVTTLRSYALMCPSLGIITIPQSVTTIEAYAFYMCTGIKSITLPNTITTINANDFAYCLSLVSVALPYGLTAIAVSAFAQCVSLSSITIPSSVATLTGSIFTSNVSLRTIAVPSGVTSIEGNLFQNCYSLQEVILPSSLTTIKSYAFSGCVSLKIINIPSGVTSIETGAFQGCSSLISINIPSITELSNNCFYQCISLVSITVPEDVTTIGTYTFLGTSRIKSYYFFSETPPTIATTSIGTTGDTVIYVPAASVEAYKTAANWTTLASRIQAMPTT